MSQINLANVPKKSALNNTDRMAVWPEIVTDDSDLEHTTIADVVSKVNTDIASNYVPLTPVDAKGDLLVGTANNTVGVLPLGTNNHVLTADSAQATGTKWAPVISPTLVDAKGDLIVGTANDTVARLAAGTNGHILYANSAATNGVEWAAPPAGKVVKYATASSNTDLISTDPFDAVTISYTALNSSNILIIEASFIGFASFITGTAIDERVFQAKIRNTTDSVDVIPISTIGRRLVSASTGFGTMQLSTLLRAVITAGSTASKTYALQINAFGGSPGQTTCGSLGAQQPTRISIMELTP